MIFLMALEGRKEYRKQQAKHFKKQRKFHPDKRKRGQVFLWKI